MTNMVSNALLSQAQRAVAVGLLLLLGGCIPLYIPPFGGISSERLKEIKVGSTTRQQVVHLLGESDKLKHENFSVYDLYSSKGGFVFVFPAGAAMWSPLDTRYYRVLLEFDSNAIVKRYEIEDGSPQPHIFGTGGGVAPLPKADVAETAIKRIFKGVVRGWWGQSQIMEFRSVAFSPDGRVLAGGATGGQVFFWDTETGDQKMILEGGGTFIRFSPDGKLVVTAEGSMPTIWELPSGARKLSFEGHGSSGFFRSRNVRTLAISPDSKMVVSGADSFMVVSGAVVDGSIKVWEAATGKTLNTFELSGGVSSVVFSPDGKIIAATSEKEVIMWDLANGSELGRITAGSKAGACAFSPDGRLLAVATLSHVEIWRLPFDYQVGQPAYAESSEATSLRRREELVTVFLLPYVQPARGLIQPSVVFSADSSKVAASASGAVIGDLSGQRAIFGYYPPLTLKAHREDDFLARDVAFSPDGKTAAFATYGGVYLFEVPSTQPAGGSANVAEQSGEPGEGKK